MVCKFVTYAILISMLNIFSWNVNGLRSIVKVKKVFALIEEWKSDLCCLQETFWDDELMSEIQHLWNGKIFFNNSTEKCHCGVAILVNNNLKDYVHVLEKDTEGRFISLKFKQENTEFNLMNIYAPNSCKERTIFFGKMAQCNFNDKTIMCGDFNTSLNYDDRFNTIHVKDSALETLRKMISDRNLCDIWRQRNQNKRTFSWKRIIEDRLKMSRIDICLIHESMKLYTKNIFYKETSMSDHSLIHLQIDFSIIERGPGVWVLNNTFLNENAFCSQVDALIIRERNNMLYGSNLLVWWDSFKYKVKKISQLYGKNRNRDRNKQYYRIQNKFDDLTQKMNDGLDYDVTKYERLKGELASFEEERCKGAILRSKSKWALESDKSTKYFLNLETYRQTFNSISKLQAHNGKILNNTDDIIKEVYTYYSQLYSNINTEDTDIDDFLNVVNTKVCESDRDMCDSKITEEEIYSAISSMKRNKSPGPDGITVEFYLKFWNQMKHTMLKVFNNIQEGECMTRSMRLGHITLIYKNKGDRQCLKNWRPISLLNVDYKILARIMSNRLKYVLPNIVSNEQTCCVMGRDISENICGIRDIIDMAEREEIEGYILKLDQEKAFDRISHQYLFKVLEKFGFGSTFIKWIKIFYKDIRSAVKLNGFITDYFSIQNSVRQGCPISALLFVLAAEPLNLYIKQSQAIKGIQIPYSDRTSLIYQHADDTTLTLADKNSITKTFDVFELYGKASGAKINKNKSELLCIGRAVFGKEELERVGITLCENVIEILGVYVGKCYKKCIECNWEKKIEKIQKILNMWKQRRLTVQGRAIVVSNLLLSKMWYTLTVQHITDKIIQEIKTMLLKFIWLNNSYPVRYNTIIGEKDEGGLNIPDIQLKMKAFRLKFLKRFLDTSYTAVWKETMQYFLRSICNLNFTYECLYLKYNKKMLQNIPVFYSEMLLAWNEIGHHVEHSTSIAFIYNQPLFHNPNICYQERTLYFRFFVEAGMTKLKDICYEYVPGFLKTELIIETIQEKCENVSRKTIENAILVIRHSLPIQWELVVKTKGNPRDSLGIPDYIIRKENKFYPLLKSSTSTIYKTLRNDIFFEPISKRFWRQQFEKLDQNIMFQHIHTQGKLPEMIELDFRIAHNIIYTKDKLYKYGMTTDEMCPFCMNNVENIVHMYIHCQRLSHFKSFLVYHIESLLSSLHNSEINKIDFNEILIFGLHKSLKKVNNFFVNFLLSVARLSIYKTRNNYIQNGRYIPIKSLFKYTLQNYVMYSFTYYENKNNIEIFRGKFIDNNHIIALENNKLVYNW